LIWWLIGYWGWCNEREGGASEMKNDKRVRSIDRWRAVVGTVVQFLIQSFASVWDNEVAEYRRLVKKGRL